MRDNVLGARRATHLTLISIILQRLLSVNVAGLNKFYLSLAPSPSPSPSTFFHIVTSLNEECDCALFESR